jgi:hypothetical protein
MTGKNTLYKKYFGPITYVGDLVSSNLQTLRVKKYRMGLQTYTFIRLYINGVKKIIYIQNLENEFFSNKNVYNMNYINDLKVEYIMDDSNEENKKINLRRRSLQSKEIGN